jgi:hypothetical protein
MMVLDVLKGWTIPLIAGGVAVGVAFETHNQGVHAAIALATCRTRCAGRDIFAPDFNDGILLTPRSAYDL